MISLLRSARQLANRSSTDVSFGVLRSLTTQADTFFTTTAAASASPPFSWTTETELHHHRSAELDHPRAASTQFSTLVGYHAMLPETAAAVAQLSVNYPLSTPTWDLPEFGISSEMIGT